MLLREPAGPQAFLPQQATITLPFPHTAPFFKDSQSLLRKSVIEIIVTSLVVQWLRLCAPNARAEGSTSGQGTKIPYNTQHGQKIHKYLKNSLKKKTAKRNYRYTDCSSQNAI